MKTCPEIISNWPGLMQKFSTPASRYPNSTQCIAFSEVTAVTENEKSTENRTQEKLQNRVKFEVYGEEMIEKKVKSSGNSGRVYLPPNWVGHQVKIIRID